MALYLRQFFFEVTFLAAQFLHGTPIYEGREGMGVFLLCASWRQNLELSLSCKKNVFKTCVVVRIFAYYFRLRGLFLKSLKLGPFESAKT